jgi:Fe-S oxidoreductase
MERNKKTAQSLFTSQGAAIRTVAGMQVGPDGMKKLMGRQVSRNGRASALFWIGCNLPRTAHLVLTIEEIFERLDLNVEVLGGQDNCCGIVHFREGDNDTGEKIVGHTVQNMERFSPDFVIAWCPTCHLQFSELLRGYIRADLQFQHVTQFLVDRLDILGSQWVRRIEKKVALHEHRGVDGVAENIRTLVSAIPGITIVEIPQLGNYGYMCSRLESVPRAKAAVHRQVLDAAQAAGVDVVVTPYHSCQRDLCIAERDFPFEVKNFVTLIGEALGIEHEDKYKKYKMLGDAEKIMREAEPFARQNKLGEEEVRRIVEKEFLSGPTVYRGGK